MIKKIKRFFMDPRTKDAAWKAIIAYGIINECRVWFWPFQQYCAWSQRGFERRKNAPFFFLKVSRVKITHYYDRIDNIRIYSDQKKSILRRI